MTGNWRWLKSTKELQESAFGIDFAGMGKHATADYVMMNVLAATDELHEALAETRWKAWARDRGDVRREPFVDELVDAVHFIANLLVMAGVTDEEWERLYQAKQERNRARQATPSGYDAVRSKCRNEKCKRELDKPGATMWTSFDHCLRCAGCKSILATLSPGAWSSSEPLTWIADVDPSVVWREPYKRDL